MALYVAWMDLGVKASYPLQNIRFMTSTPEGKVKHRAPRDMTTSSPVSLWRRIAVSHIWIGRLKRGFSMTTLLRASWSRRSSHVQRAPGEPADSARTHTPTPVRGGGHGHAHPGYHAVLSHSTLPLSGVAGRRGRHVMEPVFRFNSRTQAALTRADIYNPMMCEV